MATCKVTYQMIAAINKWVARWQKMTDLQKDAVREAAIKASYMVR